MGTCIAAPDWNGESHTGDCGQPHSLELLAFGYSGDQPVSRLDAEMTCRQLVGQLTAMPDATADGALSAHIHTTRSDGSVLAAAQIPAHSNLSCAVVTTGNRKLRGSLIALGRQPIPWA